MKKNYDFSKGVRGVHRDQTFIVLGPVKSDTSESDLKTPTTVKTVVKPEKRSNVSLKKKAVV